MERVYTNYYLSQTGCGLSDIGELYSNPILIQQGRGGIGAFFSGIYRNLKPLIMSGLNALKKQTIKTGSNVLQEIGSKPVKEILKEQGKRAVEDLTEKGLRKLRKLQDGAGTAHAFNFKHHQPIKKMQIRPKNQSLLLVNRKRVGISKPKKKRNKKKSSRDIFTN